MASIEDIIKVLKGKTALYSMGNGNASAIPKEDFMEVALEINKLFYEPQAKKLLLSISKESKRMDGTIYLVPDYTKFREAIKEAGIRE